jgi:DsbC/DsbD-like thiol-disulfide interchange protein
MFFAASLLSFAQGNILSVAPPDKIAAKTGATTQAKLLVQLRPSYHVNSNTPSDEYLIPLKLTWSAGPLETAEIVYPKPQSEKYSFSEKPLSVYTGDFEILTLFKVAATAQPGPAALSGKLRYQACNDRMCFPPKSVDITLPVDIVK